MKKEKVPFDYIKNEISSYKRVDLINFCYKKLDDSQGQIYPVWTIFTLMKWAYLFGESKFPIKKLNQEAFSDLCNKIFEYNQDYLIQLVKENQVDRAFLILHNQQLYLNKKVYKEVVTTQLKLYTTLSGKYDIAKSFQDKAQLSIKEFLQISLIIWGYSNQIEGLSIPKFNGYLDADFWVAMTLIVPKRSLDSYIKLLTLNPNKIEAIVNNFRKSIKIEELQNLEMSFFTMYPFQFYNNRLRLIHTAIFGSVVTNFIYDYLKENDSQFTTEFGTRVEKFVRLGIEELKLPYKPESELKKILGRDVKVVDYYLTSDNVYIECKASELQAYPTVNPTDELLYNSLESSFIKAYFDQLNPVASKLSPDKENWGIIITYKEFFYSQYTPLYEIGIKKYPTFEKKSLPPENVFIIDLFTWNKIVHIIKSKGISLCDVLSIARENNKKPETTKQFFDMHLADFNLTQLDLEFLKDEEMKILTNNKNNVR